MMKCKIHNALRRFIAIYSNRALHEIKLSDEESYLSKVILNHKNFKRLLMYS